MKGCKMSYKRTTTELRALDCVDDISEMSGLLQECLRALNWLPNEKYNGEQYATSYELASAVSQYLEGV
jgi:hypothetical protein